MISDGDYSTSIQPIQSFERNVSQNPKTAEPPKVIYVNPNYGVKKHVIHVNPNVHATTSVHENSRIHSSTSVYVNTKNSTKSLIHVNPKIVKNMDVIHRKRDKSNKNINTVTLETSTVLDKIQKSIYVNPKLLKKMNCTEILKNTTIKKNLLSEEISYLSSKLDLVKSVSVKKNAALSLMSSSRRRLVKVKRNSKSASGTLVIAPKNFKRIFNAEFKKTKVDGSTLLSSTSYAHGSNNMLEFIRIKSKENQRNIDRTVVQRERKKKANFVKSKVLSSSMKLVSIGGVSYKSSKNKLVRRTSISPMKKRKNIANIDQDQFFIATNGKALRRLDSTRKCQSSVNHLNNKINMNGINVTRRPSNVSFKQNVKNTISNKVKQRSIQILRNKMRKNNQPCILFQKFGYCTNQAKGTCLKVHDKKQVALCRNFLQGKCFLGHCHLSHDVGPEKMPTCKYFLEGCCTRDACPYLHVKFSENTPICRQFLQGYCEMGQKCGLRHIRVCPEFEMSGNCSKTTYCPYPHKHKALKVSSTLQEHNSFLTLRTSESTEPASCGMETKKRYYDTYSGNLSKQEENLVKNFVPMKSLQATYPVKLVEDDKVIITKNFTESEIEFEFKRPPIGPLPSYIPIN